MQWILAIRAAIDRVRMPLQADQHFARIDSHGTVSIQHAIGMSTHTRPERDSFL